jgi:hypothetical protein
MEKEIKTKVERALNLLYEEDRFIIESGLCERCITHRFAVHLEKQNFGDDYYVDCEYNKSHIGKNTSSKKVSNINGNYIDIIITKRDGNYINDLVCFEVKKWDAVNRKDKNGVKEAKKDRQNIKILTGGIKFGYSYGFFIIFGKTLSETKIEYYKNGKKQLWKNP